MMNLKKFFALPLIISGCLFITAVSAESIDMRSVGDTPSGISKPQNGMSMASVLQQYGDPESKQNPVGEPPITRWNFGSFAVYFEHNQVIHSVTYR